MSWMRKPSKANSRRRSSRMCAKSTSSLPQSLSSTRPRKRLISSPGAAPHIFSARSCIRFGMYEIHLRKAHDPNVQHPGRIIELTGIHASTILKEKTDARITLLVELEWRSSTKMSIFLPLKSRVEEKVVRLLVPSWEVTCMVEMFSLVLLSLVRAAEHVAARLYGPSSMTRLASEW